MIVLAVTLAADFLLSGSLAVTLLHSDLELWPPPGRNSWQYWLTWISTQLFAIGTVALGALDRGSIPLPTAIRLGLGLPLLIAGLSLALWAVRSLGVESSLGLGGPIERSGPYRFSRNPQYVGDIAVIAGFVLLSSSWLALISGLIGGLWFVLAPLAEEPWLRARYGGDYEEYFENTPRFL